MKLSLLFVFLFFATVSISAQENNDSIYSKFRFGGYGEVLYKNMDFGLDRYNNPGGAPKENRSTIGLPRVVFSFEYKFRNDIELVSEIEIENGGTGTSLELEYEEAGEYEMEVEKAGEIMLEQLYIKKTFSPMFQIKVGHIILPVGRLNLYHLPTEYFATVRPEGETQILPTTWHETGIAFTGTLSDWKYELQVVNGLDANGFSRAYWVGTGYQRLFEDIKATQMALVLRIDNHSIPNTRVSVSGYRGKSALNTSKPEKMKNLDGMVSIASSDAEFNNRRFIARANFLYGDLTNSYEIGAINQTISKNIQYPRTPVAKNAMTYSFEMGYDIFTHFRTPGKLIPFVRYEYYNSMQNTSNGVWADARFKRDVITAGINYFIMPQLVLKADYSSRIIDGGNYNTENTIGISLAYSAYFLQK